MDELRVYVDALFARRGDTAENREMKEEIYGNLAARRDDLIAQGVPEAEAVRAAKAQLPSLDGVLGTVVRVNAQQWRTARLQSLLLASVILWVLTIPLLLVRGQISCLAAFVLAVVFGVWYLCSLRGESCVTMTVDAVQLRRQSRTVWLVWGVCFAVCVPAVSAVLFSSNVWFSRPVRIDGPYALGVMAAPYYLALSTVVFPIAVGRFPLLIAQCERGETDEA